MTNAHAQSLRACSASFETHTQRLDDGTPSVTASSPLRSSARPRAPHGRWATRAGRSPGSRLWRFGPPSQLPHPGRLAPLEHREQWHSRPLLAADSCGGSRGFEFRHRPIRQAPHLSPRSLFIHRRLRAIRNHRVRAASQRAFAASIRVLSPRDDACATRRRILSSMNGQ